ncbi:MULTISPECIES: DUF2510 domain-containing protein [unclassified Nocardioides]|uniref:DUF2510 domain-containing protein n=1 Tax=unclassified Nocardioides TaxID=2615069 RepID=UPI001305405E|nr:MULTISPECIES: DUF2510 domain-containing protein [unclassified Nocardioides]
MRDGYGNGAAIGAIANGYILAAHGTWVPLNANANSAGPWYPGDIVNDWAFTGANWVVLPAGWRPDPTGRHDFRWWNGHAWSEHVTRNGVQFAESGQAFRPMPSSARLPEDHKSKGFWDVVDTFGTLVSRLAFSGWVIFWLILAIWSAWVAWHESEPKLLLLTATASANVFSYKLTGTSWKTLKKRLTKLPYVICGVVAAGGVWLSLHFDDPDVLKVTMIVVLIGLFTAWVFS